MVSLVVNVGGFSFSLIPIALSQLQGSFENNFPCTCSKSITIYHGGGAFTAFATCESAGGMGSKLVKGSGGLLTIFVSLRRHSFRSATSAEQRVELFASPTGQDSFLRGHRLCMLEQIPAYSPPSCRTPVFHLAFPPVIVVSSGDCRVVNKPCKLEVELCGAEGSQLQCSLRSSP